MSLKQAFATVLKAMRAGRGLTQKNLAEVSSRTYVSKLERGQSSPTMDMITALSGALNVSPLTLITITLGAESGQSVNALLKRTQSELADLSQTEIFKDIGLQYDDERQAPPHRHRPPGNSLAPAAQHQIELSLSE